jgi:hypothetical protein
LAYTVVNGFHDGYVSQCLLYFYYAWTFQGLELVVAVWILSLVIFVAGLGVVVVLRVRKKKAAKSRQSNDSGSQKGSQKGLNAKDKDRH